MAGYNAMMISIEKAVRGTACLSFGPLVPGKYLARPNRFRTEVDLDGTTVAAYLANPGRLKELLIPGRRVWLQRAPGAHRKTSYNLTLIELPHTWISLNSHLPNALIAQALERHLLSGVSHDAHLRREVRLGNSRIDFCLEHADGRLHWIEVKSVTLVEESIAAFPDAPTQRGRRHLGELSLAVEQGDHATVIFVIQREDAEGFTSHDVTDPNFGAALRQAVNVGIDVCALRCTLSSHQICLDREVPVLLDAPSP